jgi:hypothetical protein
MKKCIEKARKVLFSANISIEFGLFYEEKFYKRKRKKLVILKIKGENIVYS